MARRARRSPLPVSRPRATSRSASSSSTRTRMAKSAPMRISPGDQERRGAYGGNPLMAPNPTPSDEDIANLIAFIRSLKGSRRQRDESRAPREYEFKPRVPSRVPRVSLFGRIHEGSPSDRGRGSQGCSDDPSIQRGPRGADVEPMLERLLANSPACPRGPRAPANARPSPATPPAAERSTNGRAALSVTDWPRGWAGRPGPRADRSPGEWSDETFKPTRTRTATGTDATSGT